LAGKLGFGSRCSTLLASLTVREQANFHAYIDGSFRLTMNQNSSLFPHSRNPWPHPRGHERLVHRQGRGGGMQQ
jgi:hypothetical protein